MKEDVSASFLDKTDWRVTLHRKLEACVDAEGTYNYNNKVKSLISAASAQYPGWNAEKEINDELFRLEKKYTNMWDTWINDNLTRIQPCKDKYHSRLVYCIHKEMFDFIKNMCARKRMLLWGSKKVPGGTQMEYTE